MQPLDLVFIIWAFSIIVGLFATILAINYYRKIGSTEYLYMAIFFYGVILHQNTFLTIFLYFSPWLDWFYSADPAIVSRYIDVIQPWVIITREIYFIGTLLLLVQTIRMRPWGEYSRATQVFATFLILESVLQIIKDTAENIGMIILNTPFLTGSEWFNKLSIFFLIFPQENLNYFALNLHYTLVFAFIGYLYLQLRSQYKHPIIKRSIIAWVIFSSLLSLSWLIPMFTSVPTIALTPDQFLLMYNMTQTIQVSGLVVLMLMIMFYPESLLITEYQINKATKIYSLIKQEDTGRIPVIGMQHLKEYVESLSFGD